MKKTPLMKHHSQTGTSLIELLVAMLVLSLGVLPLVAMMTFSVQMPKLAGYRATAVNLSTNYIERMRANPVDSDDANRLLPYSEINSSYDGTPDDIASPNSGLCDYPSCRSDTMVTRDVYEMQVATRRELPAGGIVVSCDDPNCSNGFGNLWIMWQEPDTFAALDPSTSDNCPTGLVVGVNDLKPRCLYVRFKL
jgi:type IV pilus assembly protein PilV